MLPVVFYAYNHVIFMILFSTFAFFSYTHFSIFIFNGYLLSLTIVGHVLFYFMCIELFFIPVCVCVFLLNYSIRRRLLVLMMGLLVQSTLRFLLLLIESTRMFLRRIPLKVFLKHNFDMCTMAFYKAYRGS